MYSSENQTCTNFPESRSGKHFYTSAMRAINFPHKITPRKMILRQESQTFSTFASIQNTHFPESGSGKRFQIFASKKHEKTAKIPAFFDTFLYYPNSNIVFPQKIVYVQVVKRESDIKKTP
jgi:hypothetical protein